VAYPHLGLIESDEKSAQGMLLYRGQSIPLRVESDDKTIEEALSFATVIASALAFYDQMSKDIIVASLLESYNSGWNEYDEVQEDGTTKSVLNPKLSATEFRERFILCGVNIGADTCASLWYEDGGLFWGHSVFVESLDGADFTNARAELAG
jgi:hypothetical protein